ncbi:MAG: hypothetical protein ACOCTT_02085 [archaeon]
MLPMMQVPMILETAIGSISGTAISVFTALTLPLSNLIPGFLADLTPEIGTWDMIMIGIRLVGLISIIHFVRTKITNSAAATIIILVLSYILLFRYATFFLPVLVIIIFIPHGPLQLIFDLALGGGAGPEEAKKKKSKMRKMKEKRKKM